MVTRNSGTIDDLKKIIRSINIIGNKTSKIFLEEGTNLIPISKSIEKIIEELELINNEIMKNGYNEVLNVISNFETFISNNIFVEDSFFEDNLNKINSINYKITELDNSIKGFYKIVKSLNFVRVNIKIENARVTNGNIEFEDVAKVIERLCLVIKEKISELGETLNKCLFRIKKEKENLKSSDRNFEVSIKESFNSAIYIIIEKQKEISQTLIRSKEIFNDINSEINQLIVSIQYHDITEQRLRHIKSAFEELIVGIISTKIDDSEKHNLIIRTLSIQKLQIQDTFNDIKNASKNIYEKIQNINLNIEIIIDLLTEILPNKINDNKSGIILLEEIFLKNTNYVETFFNQNDLLKDTLAFIIEKTSSLKIYMDEINDIRSEVELLAVNSEIFSYQLRGESATLGVLSNEMYKIAKTTKSISENYVEQIENINAIALDLESKHDILISRKSKFIENRVDVKYKHIGLKLTDIERQTEKYSRTFTKEAASAQATINSLKINFEDNEHIDVEYNACIELIDKNISDINFKIDELTLVEHKTLEDNHFKNYTMEKERVVHLKAFNDNDKNDLLQISKNNKQNSGEFGLNVELF